MTGGSSKVRHVMSLMRDAGVLRRGALAARLGRHAKHQHRDRTRVVELGVETRSTTRIGPNCASEVRRRDGTRMLTYVNPFLMDARGAKGALYREAKENGYMVRTVSGSVYRLGTEPGVSYGLIDLTNPDAARWIEDVIVDMARDVGASGWMADFGEYLPFDCALHSGEQPVAVHNRYPEDWAALNRRALRRAGLASESEGDGEACFGRAPRRP